MLAFISNILKNQKDDKILICCPDNASADAMTLQLIEMFDELEDNDLFLRVYSMAKTE